MQRRQDIVDIPSNESIAERQQKESTYPSNPRNAIIDRLKMLALLDLTGNMTSMLDAAKITQADEEDAKAAWANPDISDPNHPQMQMMMDMAQMSSPLAAAGTVGKQLSQELLHELAVKYNMEKKLGEIPETFQKLNPKFSQAVASEYDKLIHNPNLEEVVNSYKALSNEVADQYQLLKEAGLKTTATPEQKYKNSKDMIQDVVYNNHLYYFPTEAGYGSDLNKIDTNHPMLKDVNGMNINDQFRVVHDVFGHAKPGTGFGPVGEEKAYQLHKAMLSPEAQKALATETRGQNSWVNFGPKAEFNKANPESTVFADQKAAILPEWARGSIPQTDDELNKVLSEIYNLRKKP